MLIVFQIALPKIKVIQVSLIAASLAAMLSCDFASAQTFVDRKSPDSFRIANYNVFSDSLFENDGLDELARFVNAVDADVYAFQEAFDTSSSQARNLFNQIAPLATGSWQVHKGRNQLIISRYSLSMLDVNVPNGTRGIAMALVDLPDSHFFNDMYILNNHFPCCDSGEGQRRVEAEAIAEWLSDAISVGGDIDLAQDTAVAIVGDLNTVSGYVPRDTLLDGIDSMGADWDGTSIADASPTHNAIGLADYTWRNDFSPFEPGVLDYVLYTDSAISVEYSFVLNPSIMSNAELAATGLIETDMMRTKIVGGNFFDFDHLPLIVDFAANLVVEPLIGDVNLDGEVNFLDISPFIAVLAAEGFQTEADVNFDGVVNFFDISPLIAVLSDQ